MAIYFRKSRKIKKMKIACNEYAYINMKIMNYGNRKSLVQLIVHAGLIIVKAVFD